MRRFTILRLMSLVFALALGLAALRGANDAWAGGLMLATPLLLGIALIGALCGEVKSRAGRLGFAILGGAYFALAFLGVSERNLSRLPTRGLLRYTYEHLSGPSTQSYFISTVTTSTPQGVVLTEDVSRVNFSATPVPDGSQVVLQQIAAPTKMRWNLLASGSANQDGFITVGQCLFALLAGWLGAFIAGRFERAQAREAAGRPVAGPASGPDPADS